MTKEQAYEIRCGVKRGYFKPCPFCGSDEIRLLPQEHGHSVDCLTCGARKRVFYAGKRQARAEWNTRRGPS